MNVEAVFQSLVGLGATWILWLLVALSVGAFAVILERWVFFARSRESAEALRSELKQGLNSGDTGPLGVRLTQARSVEARILGVGLSADSAEEAEELMAAEAQLQRLRSEKSLAYLGTLGNNAPFVGLLGTVVGIIGAFEELGLSGGQLTTGLMAEIGEALVATAVGLLVALPAVAAYNAFQRTIAVRLSQGDALGRMLIAGFYSSGKGLPESRRSSSLRVAGAE